MQYVRPVNQLYFITDGAVTIKLGKDIDEAAAGSAVFIPAGVPQRNWRSGGQKGRR